MHRSLFFLEYRDSSTVYVYVYVYVYMYVSKEAQIHTPECVCVCVCVCVCARMCMCMCMSQRRHGFTRQSDTFQSQLVPPAAPPRDTTPRDNQALTIKYILFSVAINPIVSLFRFTQQLIHRVVSK